MCRGLPQDTRGGGGGAQAKPLAAWGLITIAKSMGKVKAKYRLLSTIQMTFGVVEFTAIA